MGNAKGQKVEKWQDHDTVKCPDIFVGVFLCPNAPECPELAELAILASILYLGGQFLV